VELKEIRTLIDLMKKNGLSVFKMEREDFKITLKTPEAGSTQVVSMAHVPSMAAPAPVAAAAPTAAPAAPASDLKEIKEIKSPMVGTFYSAPSPDSESFVSVGQSIGAESVVCIIEAMKVMNEIKAEIGGTVVEICAENGKPVQFGQVLFRVK
jgi:acetyl-CoA carboxylase biotin carboxyl carrier protein